MSKRRSAKKGGRRSLPEDEREEHATTISIAEEEKKRRRGVEGRTRGGPLSVFDGQKEKEESVPSQSCCCLCTDTNPALKPPSVSAARRLQKGNDYRNSPVHLKTLKVVRLLGLACVTSALVLASTLAGYGPLASWMSLSKELDIASLYFDGVEVKWPVCTEVWSGFDGKRNLPNSWAQGTSSQERSRNIAEYDLLDESNVDDGNHLLSTYHNRALNGYAKVRSPRNLTDARINWYSSVTSDPLEKAPWYYDDVRLGPIAEQRDTHIFTEECMLAQFERYRETKDIYREHYELPYPNDISPLLDISCLCDFWSNYRSPLYRNEKGGMR